MALEQTWRWFGPKDPVTLKEIRHTGASAVVTALHQIPIGEVWPVDAILERKRLIEAEGLTWSVAESLPVHEHIKKYAGNYRELIGKYTESIGNLGKCGVDTVCYNFMPVLDWSRTDLQVEFKDGSITTRFEGRVFAAFDLFILKRPGAEKSYSDEQVRAARAYFDDLNNAQKDALVQTILLGFPGSEEAYTIKQFSDAIREYQSIGDHELMEHLHAFLKEIIPAAEESGVFMALHPDDPPWSLLGLPRIVSNADDLEQHLKAVDSPSNGLTFCTGSLGASVKNNVGEMAQRLAQKVNFVHLRNVSRNDRGDFLEDNHLEGDVDMYSVMKTMVIEQQRREQEGTKNRRMPFRPDHGHLTIADRLKPRVYPGYSLFGRMRALSELRGLEVGIERSLPE
ncbi:MAG TPA: mannonate dehydratase [Bacteroidota bacterium]|nr:mannonate dehydratase [Bacteroidota bacterium]